MKLVLLLLYFVKYVIIVKTIYSVLLKGSKSAEGSPYPLADMDPGGPNPLGGSNSRGVQIRWDMGTYLRKYS